MVGALEAYHSERGTYPPSLDELVPDYLPSVPDPAWGLGRWTYRRYAGDAAGAPVYFSLAVPANDSGYPVLFYDVTMGSWVLNN